MPPNAFLRIRVHEGCLAVCELSRMADSHVIGEPEISKPFIGEDKSVGIAVALHERNECVSSTIRNNLQQALLELPGNTAENPLRCGNRFIPL